MGYSYSRSAPLTLRCKLALLAKERSYQKHRLDLLKKGAGFFSTKATKAKALSLTSHSQYHWLSSLPICIPLLLSAGSLPPSRVILLHFSMYFYEQVLYLLSIFPMTELANTKRNYALLATTGEILRLLTRLCSLSCCGEILLAFSPSLP